MSPPNQPPRLEISGNTGTDCRRMLPGKLLGNHSHETADGRRVHVWVRGSRYLARGYHNRKAFGKDLGTDPREAAAALRRLLVELEDGTFIPPSEARKRQLKARQAPATLCASCATPSSARSVPSAVSKLPTTTARVLRRSSSSRNSPRACNNGHWPQTWTGNSSSSSAGSCTSEWLLATAGRRPRRSPFRHTRYSIFWTAPHGGDLGTAA